MSCTKCDLHKTCKNVQIEGRGSENPDILWVGQNPGQEEDRMKQVFIGPSGQLLIEGIKEFNLKPSRLTNVVRCASPGDKKPTKEQVEACFPYLVEEIQRTKPKIIVAVGDVAMRALTGRSGMKDYSGKVCGEFEGRKVFALFHPSYILRMPSQMSKFESHLKALQALAQTPDGAAPEVETQIVDPETATAWLLEEKELVTFDFETNGKFQEYGGRIVCVGFQTSTRNFVVKHEFVMLDRQFDKMMRTFLRQPVKKCAFNSLFESRWCIDKWKIDPQITLDPYLMHYLLDENSSHDLETVAYQELGVPGWDISTWMKEQGYTYDTAPVETIAKYCGLDCFYPHQFAQKMRDRLAEDPELEWIYEEVLLPLSRLCVQLSRRGLQIDVDYAKNLEARYIKQCAALREKMISLLGLSKEFNPNSSKQVIEVLNSLKIKTGNLTDGGQMQVNEDSLEPLKEKHPFIKLCLEWKKKNTARNNWLTEYPKIVDWDEQIHPQFNPAFIVTGRISCSDPSAQNIPRDPEIRGIICSRFEGGKLVSTDYAQLELRLIASEAKEEKLLKIFREGGDPHNLTAQGIFGKNFSKEDRDRAKTVNFAVSYGADAWTLHINQRVPIEIAEKWVIGFKATYPGIARWMELQHKLAEKQGFIQGKFGLLRRLPDAQLPDFVNRRGYNQPPKEKRAAFRQAGNFPIQHMGAYITNIAAILVDQELTAGGFKAVLCHINHDAFIVDSPADELVEVQELCRRVMEEDMKAYTPWLTVDLKVDQKVSKRWGGLDI